ncbi:MAG: hypothetical protein U0235_06375 [Polyangiaceae bacterium]
MVTLVRYGLPAALALGALVSACELVSNLERADVLDPPRVRDARADADAGAADADDAGDPCAPAARSSVDGGCAGGSVILTPKLPKADFSSCARQVDRNAQDPAILLVDTRAFARGTLVLTLRTGTGSGLVSADLYPQCTPPPLSGVPDGSMTGRYDIDPRSTVTLSQEFVSGQIFQLAVTGAWTVPGQPYLTNTWSVTAEVIGF